MTAPFSKAETRRYSRHFILPELGARGQKRLKAARILCIGAGGLGSPAALYLAAAGIGTLGIVDFDTVDLSNLQRQIIHRTTDVGRSKLDSAVEKLTALNPEIAVVPHALRLDSSNALELFSQYDLILDGTDNYATRYLINDACVLTGKPNLSASVFRFEGQLSLFGTKDGPCYRCLYPEPPLPGMVPSCGEGGVLGVVTGVVGTLQATEAIKYVAGIGAPLAGRLMLFDALELRFREMKIRRDPACPVCGDAPSITAPIDYEAFCQTTLPLVPEITPLDLKAKLASGEVWTLIDVREPGELDINRIDGALHVPLEQLEARASDLPGTSLAFICRVGERSARAVSIMQRLCRTKVFNLTGGITRWREDLDDDSLDY